MRSLPQKGLHKLPQLMRYSDFTNSKANRVELMSFFGRLLTTNTNQRQAAVSWNPVVHAAEHQASVNESESEAKDD